SGVFLGGLSFRRNVRGSPGELCETAYQPDDQSGGQLRDGRNGGKKAEKAQHHCAYSRGAGESLHLCGTELREDLSHRGGGKKDQLPDVPGNTRGLQPLFHRGDPEKPGKEKLSVRICEKAEKQECVAVSRQAQDRQEQYRRADRYSPEISCSEKGAADGPLRQGKYRSGKTVEDRPQQRGESVRARAEK